MCLYTYAKSKDENTHVCTIKITNEPFYYHKEISSYS